MFLLECVLVLTDISLMQDSYIFIVRYMLVIYPLSVTEQRGLTSLNPEILFQSYQPKHIGKRGLKVGDSSRSFAIFSPKFTSKKCHF